MYKSFIADLSTNQQGIRFPLPIAFPLQISVVNDYLSTNFRKN